MKNNRLVIIVLVIVFLLIVAFIAFKKYGGLIEGYYPPGCGPGCRRRRRKNAAAKKHNEAIANIKDIVRPYKPQTDRNIRSTYRQTYQKQILEYKNVTTTVTVQVRNKKGKIENKTEKIVTQVPNVVSKTVTETITVDIPNTTFPTIKDDATLRQCLIGINSMLNFNTRDAGGVIVFDDIKKIVWLSMYVPSILESFDKVPFNQAENDYPITLEKGSDPNDTSSIDTMRQKNYKNLKLLCTYADSLDIDLLDPASSLDMTLMNDNIYQPFKTTLSKLI